MCHQSKSGEESPTECIETSVAVVRIWTKSLKTYIILFALAKWFVGSRRLVSKFDGLSAQQTSYPAPDELPQRGGSMGSASPKYQLAKNITNNELFVMTMFKKPSGKTYICYDKTDSTVHEKSFPMSCPISWCISVSTRPCRFAGPSRRTQTVRTLSIWLHHADSSQIQWQHQRSFSNLQQERFCDCLAHDIACRVIFVNIQVLPGIMATVLSARSTLNVLNAARFPKSIPIVT